MRAAEKEKRPCGGQPHEREGENSLNSLFSPAF